MVRISINARVLMQKIPVKQYKKLNPGTEYIFKTYNLNGFKYRKGILLNVSTCLIENEETKIKTLMGGKLIFEPLGENAWYNWNKEKLKIYSITICRGLFEIYKD